MFAALMQQAYEKVWRADLWVNLIEYLEWSRLLESTQACTVEGEYGLCKSARGFDKRV